ncbi:MAG TPA: ASPIC/UnbV domain-containing protein [Candidatus Limnocylindrales bacterium]
MLHTYADVFGNLTPSIGVRSEVPGEFADPISRTELVSCGHGRRRQAKPDAIGAWIEVKVGDTTMRRELTVDGGHAGGQLGTTHFGLGTAGEGRFESSGRTGWSGPG